MSRTRSLLVLAAAAWFVWCPVAFAVSTISVPSCHEEQEESLDCCQPLVPPSAPASLMASPLAAAALPSAALSATVPLPPRAVAQPTPLAAPPAGWGRLYVSVCVFLI